MVNVALINFTVIISVSDTFTQSPEKLTWWEAEDFLVGACQFRCRAGRQADLWLTWKRTIERGQLYWETMWRPFTKGGG